MAIVWDEDKARINEEKHGVTFQEAAEVLGSGFVELRVRRKGEKRSIAIARTEIGGEYLTVVFTTRNSVIRIISARHSSKDERSIYGRYNGRGIRP